MIDDENNVNNPNDINTQANEQVTGAETPAPQTASALEQPAVQQQMPEQPQPQSPIEQVQQPAQAPAEQAQPQPEAEITAQAAPVADIPVAEEVAAPIDDEIEDIDFDDNLEEQVIAASAVAKKGGLISFLTDKNTIIGVSAFALIGASVFGYLYYTSMQNDMLANPGMIKIKRPAVNIARGTVPGGKSPLAVMKKQGELGGKKGEMISPNIVSEILNVDDKSIEKNKVDVKNSILSDVIPQDKKARAEKLEIEKELRLANARALLEQHKLKLEEAEIEALAFEMAKAEAEKMADSVGLDELLQEDAMLEDTFSEEKAQQAKKKKEAEKKKRIAEAQKILDDIASKDAEEAKMAKKIVKAKKAKPVKQVKDIVVVDAKGPAVYTKKEVKPEDLGPSAIDLEAVADAELAIIQNATVLDTLPPPSEVPLDPREKVIPDELRSMQGKSVSDILAQKANVRPLPNRYVVVKKEREADDLEAQLTSALSAMGQNRHVAALELFNNMYRDNPDHPQVLMGRAVSMQKLGQHSAALIAYEDVLRVDPRNLEALTNMLGILKGQDNNTALFNLKQLRELYPYNAEITAQLGMVYGMIGDYPNSVKYLDMADALKPNDINILFNKAVAYDKMGKSRQAADIYRKIVYRASYDHVERTFPIDAVKRRLASIR